MDVLKKIQSQPEGTRKIILWAVMIVLGFVFVFTWVQGLKQRLKELREQRPLEQLKLPQFEEQFQNLPQVEIPEFPEITEEELKQLEEEFMKETEQEK